MEESLKQILIDIRDELRLIRTTFREGDGRHVRLAKHLRNADDSLKQAREWNQVLEPDGETGNGSDTNANPDPGPDNRSLRE